MENTGRDVENELALELALLDEAEREGRTHFRLWSVGAPTVVIGRSVDAADEVDRAFCARADIAIVRRPSGGRSVLIGPGTLQYTFALSYSVAEELSSISGAKRFCNRLLIAGLTCAANLPAGAIQEDKSGDLHRSGRKVAGLAMRRRRNAMLLHGTILVHADLALIGRALMHPRREPAYRAGRTHEEFLANLGALDERVLEHTVRGLLLANT